MRNLNAKDYLFVAVTLFGWGVVWGSLKSDVNAQGEAIKELRPVDKALAVLTEKVFGIDEKVANMDKKLDLILKNRSSK